MKESINELDMRLDNIERMLKEDRKLFLNLILRIDMVYKSVKELILNEHGILLDANEGVSDDEDLIIELINSLTDLDNKREEFIKYRKMINTDQVGES